MAKATKKAAPKVDKTQEALVDLMESHAAWLRWAERTGARNCPDVAASRAVQAAAEAAAK